MLKTEKAKKLILDILFPLECLGCGKEKEWFCHDCFQKLEFLARQSCPFCGSENLFGRTCESCSKSHSLDGIFAAGNYGQKNLSLLIRHLKYSLASDLAGVLGEFLAIALKNWQKENGRSLFIKNSFFLPIPLHSKRKKWRGFNQSELIADRLAEEFGWKKISGLERIKNSRPQAKTKETERKKNIKDCFRFADQRLDGKKIILIDDVATSGATLEEASRALKNAGAESVWGLTVARG